MTCRSILPVLASVVAAIALIALLLAASRTDLHALAAQLLALRPDMLLLLIALLGFNTFLSSEKWRLVDKRLRGPAEALPRPLYFGLTAIGTMLGAFVPVPVSAALSRSIGVHLHGGRPILRGTAATLFEQGHDVAAAAVLAPASLLLILFGGGAAAWIALAGAAAALGLLISGFAAEQMARWLQRLAATWPALRAAEGVAQSGLLRRDLVQPLFALSLLRFLTLSLMAGVVSEAAGLDVPLWQLSAAMPLVMLATAVPVAPGGIGVVEWAFAAALVAFGTPFATAAQWAIVNRVAVTVAAIAIGLIGLAVGAAARPAAPASRPA